MKGKTLIGTKGRMVPKLFAAAGAAVGAAALIGGIWKGSKFGIALGAGILASSAAILVAGSKGDVVVLPPDSDEGSRQEELQALLRDLHERSAPLPKDVVVLEEFSHEAALKAYVPQVGPVCAAASVAGALNVVFGCSDTEPFRVCDGMNVYRTIFEGKRDEVGSSNAHPETHW